MAFQPRQPKKIYSKGNLGAFLSRTGRGFGRAGGMLFGELTKKAPHQQKSSKISSPFFTKKHPLMPFKNVKSMLGGMGGVSKREKELEELRFENQIYNPNRKDDPNFSRKEAGQTVERVRQFYGDDVAEEVQEKFNKAFLGSQAITSKKAIQSVSPVRRYGKEVQEGVGLLIKGFDPKFQSGSSAKYITGEKFENVVEQTQESSGKYPAQVLKRTFGASEAQDGSKPKTSSRIAELQKGLSGWGRKSSDSSDNTNNDNK